MAEYIKRDDAFDVACAECEAGTFYDIPSKIMAIPSADVVERKHGKWIGIPHKTISKRNRTVHSMVYICPLCRYSNGRHKSNFCPNCGARMESEGANEKEM